MSLMDNWPTPEQMRQRGIEARMNADDGVTPEVGKVYTVSPCFKFGDRSWTDDFWLIEAFSGPNVLVTIHETYGKKFPRLVRADERAWFPADEAFAAFQRLSAPTQ